jgi:hypothetical protein
MDRKGIEPLSSRCKRGVLAIKLTAHFMYPFSSQNIQGKLELISGITEHPLSQGTI